MAFGADPTHARMLARSWGTTDNSRLQAAAVDAYGGLLGAWDPASAAPSHLWLIGMDKPSLRPRADHALAELMAAGGDASLIRSTVVGLLETLETARQERRRVYGLLPIIFSSLTIRDDDAAESLDALLGPAERATLLGLAGLLARAFDSSPGYQSARAVIDLLLRRVVDNRIDVETVNDLIRAIKGAAARGRRAAPGSQLERVLKAHMRVSGRLPDTAKLVHSTFYSRS